MPSNIAAKINIWFNSLKYRISLEITKLFLLAYTHALDHEISIYISSHREELKKELKEAWKDFLGEKGKCERIIKTIGIQLCNYHLVGRYSEADILNECYLRYFKNFPDNKRLYEVNEKVIGCFCKNIVREKSRASKREIYKEGVLENYAEDIYEPPDKVMIFSCLRSSLKKLKPEERFMLKKRFSGSKPMKWEEIKDLIKEEFGEDVKINTLRKRFSKLLKQKLRKMIMDCYSEKEEAL